MSCRCNPHPSFPGLSRRRGSSSSSSSSSTEMTFDASLLLRGRMQGVDMQCDSPSASARSRKVRRVVPVSLSSSLLPHRKKIKIWSHSSPPLFRDGGDGSVALSTKSRMEECDGGYDASANLSVEESETSMSFGSFRDDEEEEDDEDEPDDEMDDESSFSELSYDGVAFDFGYGRRRLSVRTGLPPIGSHHRHRTIVVEIPDHVRQEMDRRALESELEHKRSSEQRIPEALQEVFLRSQRGEPVDHPPPSGVAFKVFSWPHARAPETAESQPCPSKGTPVGAGDGHTCAPTQPRRRGSLSAASTIKDDDGSLEAEKVPLVLDRWRPLARKYYDPGHRHHHRHAQHVHHQRPRIPLELQDVFIKAQQGHDVDAPPIRGIGFKIFDNTRCGTGPTAPSNRWGPYHHSSNYHCRQGAHEAPIATSVRHE
jgi:hypothetical protein